MSKKSWLRWASGAPAVRPPQPEGEESDKIYAGEIRRFLTLEAAENLDLRAVKILDIGQAQSGGHGLEFFSLSLGEAV